MIEKPKRPKKPDIQERQPPRTLQELINRYDLDNTKVYDFLDELVGQINDNNTSTSENIDSITEDINSINGDISTITGDISSLQAQINDKNIITVQLPSDFSISTTDTATDIKTFSQYAKVGSKLSVSNGCIKIGKGVSKVKVSYNAVAQNATSTATSRAFAYLMQNTSTLTQESIYFNRTWEQISVAHNEIIRSVAENDIFYLRTYGLKDIKFLSGGSSFCDTAITVEVIE